MLKPEKYINLEMSVINLSAIILEIINRHQLVTYDDMVNFLVKETNEQSRENFPYALSFLYLLGKIEYNNEIDSFEGIL